MSASALYNQKNPTYFDLPREDIVSIIKGTGLRVLDIGCGSGVLGQSLLKNGIAISVTGIELTPDAAKTAQTRLTEVLTGDIQELSLKKYERSFDCIICADVIEHLADPWQTLRKLSPVLTSHGFIIASIPNVKYWPVMLNLIFHDQWRYVESGVLDMTHLRFFTKTTIIEMFQNTGYSIDMIKPGFTGRRYQYMSYASLGLLTKYLTQGWLVRASVMNKDTT
jgi:2-polyprenyl-3-methyl-5-hydroxy-6-metoxy-1,4-benzoquinol methylase